MSSITSANSSFALVVAGLYPAPVAMMNYAVDDAFATEAVDYAETQMGVDGKMTAGYTPNPVPMTVSFQADSPSADIFKEILQASETARDVYWLSATITLPSTGEVFTFSRGVLTKGKKMPDAKKVLQPLQFSITWERVNRAIL